MRDPRKETRKAELDPSQRVPLHQLGKIEIAGFPYQLLHMGTWSAAFNYVPGNLVRNGGSEYLCITANTGDPPASANWTLHEPEKLTLDARRIWSKPAVSGGISTAVAIWRNGQGGHPAFATSGTDDLPFWTVRLRGSDILDGGDDLHLRCGPGIYLAKATMFLTNTFDPATMNLDLHITNDGETGAATYGYSGGGGYAVFAGFRGGTYIRQFAPVTGFIAPYEYIATAETYFEVPAASTVDIKTVVVSDTTGLTFEVNLVGPENPGASNLTIVRIGN